MVFPEITEAERVRLFTPPTGKVEVVLDTDTFNEIDDQFALTHALLSPDHWVYRFHLGSGPTGGQPCG
jgi:purine nucleosidase